MPNLHPPSGSILPPQPPPCSLPELLPAGAAGCRSCGLRSSPTPRPPTSYHTLQLFSGTIGVGFLHPNAAANPGWFTITPFTRS